MTPILVRPVREQLEHDRIIRLLQSRFRRRHAVAVNVGADRGATVRSGSLILCPDLVLTSIKGGRRLSGVVEVETGESVNHLEAMAEWGPFSRVRGVFYLYVPMASIEITRRLCEAHQISVDEIWSYHVVGNQINFTMIHRSLAHSRSVRNSKKKSLSIKKKSPKKKLSSVKTIRSKTAKRVVSRKKIKRTKSRSNTVKSSKLTKRR